MSIVDALSRLLGARASTEDIRTGENTVRLEGTFELDGQRDEQMRDVLSRIGIQLMPADDLTIRRELQVGGRSQWHFRERSKRDSGNSYRVAVQREPT